MEDETFKTIKLEIRKPHFENYMRFVFSSPEGSDIKVKRTEELGKYLFSRVRYSDVPIKKPEGIFVNLVMPVHFNDSSRYHFMYYNADDTVRINDFIESSAYLDFRTMVQTGSGDLKMDKKTIISIFSDMIYDEDKFEMLKKQEYRKRLKLRDWLIKSAKEFCY